MHSWLQKTEDEVAVRFGDGRPRTGAAGLRLGTTKREGQGWWQTPFAQMTAPCPLHYLVHRGPHAVRVVWVHTPPQVYLSAGSQRCPNRSGGRSLGSKC